MLIDIGSIVKHFEVAKSYNGKNSSIQFIFTAIIYLHYRMNQYANLIIALLSSVNWTISATSIQCTTKEATKIILPV